MTVIASDLLDSIAALREAQDKVKTQDVEALRAELAEERANIQAKAWEAGWANNIGSALDNLLREHGLEGRPPSSTAWADVTLSIPHEHAAHPSRHQELGPARWATARTLRIVWERRISVRVIHDGDRLCVCDLVTEEQVREGWALALPGVDHSAVRVEAIKPVRCAAGDCLNN